MTGPPVWTWKVSIKVQPLCLFILWILSWRDKSSCHLWYRCGEAAAGAVKESGSAGCSLAGFYQTERACGGHGCMYMLLGVGCGIGMGEHGTEVCR